MERGLSGRNLAMEAVAEAEEDADESLDDDDDDDDDDDLDGMRSKQPNQFDSLCDGVVSSMALLHESMAEFLNLKNELLRHVLPPNVLTKIALTSGKLYRSITDLNQPVDETIRLVRVYSTPWEAKSEALKKLHDDYESKKTQLNIAIKRLQLVEVHSKRIAREKRVMNWERLFMKVATQKGHGRRWKFRIKSFKEKSKQGFEVLSAYIRQLDKSDDEEEDEDEDLEPPSSPIKPDSSEDEEASESEEEDIILPSADDRETETPSEKKVTFVEPVVEKPVMFNAECWTEEPSYERQLNIRLFKPPDLEDARDIKCLISHGRDFHKTQRLDPPPPSTPETAKEEPKKVAPKRRGLIGSKVDKKKEEEERKRKEEEEKKKKTEGPVVYEDIQFPFSDAIAPGVMRPKVLIPDFLKVAVHNGPHEEMIAMATIDTEELEKLDLPSVIIPPPRPDAEVDDEEEMEKEGTEGFGGTDATATPAAGQKKSVNGREKSPEEQRRDILLNRKPILYPLYPVQASRSDGLHKPCAQLPLLMYWNKKTRPQISDKKTGTASIYDVVEDMTGFDMRVLTKDDLHKETVDDGCSAVSWTPEPESQEEKMTKEEYDALVDLHQQEIKEQEDTYEARIQEMMENINQLQDVITNMRPYSPRVPSPHMSSRVPSARPTTPETTKKKPRFIRVKAVEKRPVKNFRVGRPLPKWGEDLPEDFFERMELLQKEAEAHRQQLTDDVLTEMKEKIERNLAGEYKLGAKREDEMYDALKDVSLPALFMPLKSNSNVYNPRAHQYFHPTGSVDLRLTQPPSMIQLPPLPKSKLSIVNLFDLSQNFSTRGPEWLMQQYLAQQDDTNSVPPRKTPLTPAPTMNVSVKADTFVMQKAEPNMPDRNQSAAKLTEHLPSERGDTVQSKAVIDPVPVMSAPQAQQV